MKGRTPSADQRARFLAELARTSNVTASAQAIGYSRRGMYGLRETDAEFAADWDEAIEMGVDALEHAARDRAITGVIRYVTCKDGLVLDKFGVPVTERHFSDAMTALLLKAHRPEKFKDRQAIEHSGLADIAAVLDARAKEIDSE